MRPAQPESAFVPVSGQDLHRIFSLHHERVVNRDNTISFGSRILQIERVNWRGTLAGCRVQVCEHLDGSLSVFYGPQRVARFESVSQSEKPAAESCGKDAPCKPLGSGVRTALGNPAHDAGFPLSHSYDDGALRHQ
jgi:hypothetical protein